MDPNLIQLQGILTAQSHLIELLLGANLANAKARLANVEKLRRVLDHQFRFGMEASGNKSHIELSAIQNAALNHLHQLLDNVRDRFSDLQEPPKPSARLETVDTQRNQSNKL